MRIPQLNPLLLCLLLLVGGSFRAAMAQTAPDSTRLSYGEEMLSRPLPVDTVALRVQREERDLWKLGLNNFALRGHQRYGVHIAYERKLRRPAWSVLGEVSPALLHYDGNHFTVRTQLAGRYYYNLERRIRQGRNAGNFSANYFSVAVGAGLGRYSDLPFYLNATDRHLGRAQVALLYGVQRRLGHRGFFDVNAGFAENMLSSRYFQYQTAVSLRVGLVLDGSQASRAYVPEMANGILLPRWYVGAQAGVYGYGVRYTEAKATTNRSFWPVPYLYAGYYLNPRLTVQLGIQARRKHSFKGSYYYGRADDFYYKYEVNERMIAVPVLLRYSLTKLPQQRTQVEVIAGATLTAAQARYQRQDYERNGQQVTTVNGEDQGFGVNPMLGIGLAYGFGRTRRVQAIAEGVFIKPLSSYGSSPGISAGLRYRFAYQ